jgi:bleomycin hydrolase
MTTVVEPKKIHHAAKSSASALTHGKTVGGDLSADFIASLNRDFDKKPNLRLAQNAVTQTAADDIALNRAIVTSTDHTFSHLLDDWAVTHQKKSGRCWMFAGLNLFRVGAMKKMNLKDFEFSQNYTLFWDKFERANYFLEAMIEMAERDVDDRTVACLLDRPLEDGGQWNMFINIVRKHGVVPKAVMPETQSSSDTSRMNAMLIHKLREGAKSLRDLRGKGAPMEAVRTAKHEILAAIHRILCVHLGTPPAKFDWQWNDKDRKFHRDGELTPQEFAKRYIVKPRGFATESAENTKKANNEAAQLGTTDPFDLDDYICLVHDPRPTSPVNRTFTVEYLGNVVGAGGAGRVIYLNVDIKVMKDIAMRTLMDGEPVWFGCDVGKQMRRDMGIWDANIFDYGSLYDTTFGLSKAERLQYHQTLMTHAMLFTGVDVVGSAASPRVRRWRVENSWGEENNGRKGFFVMNDNWFDEHMFEIAANRNRLPPELHKALEQEPIVLPAWDPMGALAR